MSQLIQDGFSNLARATAETIIETKANTEELQRLKAELLERVVAAIAPYWPIILGHQAEGADPIDLIYKGAGIMVGNQKGIFLYLSLGSSGPVFVEKIPNQHGNDPSFAVLSIDQVVQLGWWPSSVIYELAKRIELRLGSALDSKTELYKMIDLLRLTLRIVWPK